MSIETTLTLIAAAALLGAALLLSLTASVLRRSLLWAWRSVRGRPAGRHLIDDAVPRAPLYVRFADGTKAGALYLAATIAEPVRSLIRGLHLLFTPVGPVVVSTQHRHRSR